MFLRLFAAAVAVFASTNAQEACVAVPSNNCISFQVSSGTGCQWMCNYCATTLGTTNYYFTSDVCTYETGGCVGSPQVGVLYTCCAN